MSPFPLAEEAWHDKDRLSHKKGPLPGGDDWAEMLSRGIRNGIEFLKRQPSGMKCCLWEPNKNKKIENVWQFCKCKCRVKY